MSISCVGYCERARIEEARGQVGMTDTVIKDLVDAMKHNKNCFNEGQREAFNQTIRNYDVQFKSQIMQRKMTFVSSLILLIQGNSGVSIIDDPNFNETVQFVEAKNRSESSKIRISRIGFRHLETYRQNLELARRPIQERQCSPSVSRAFKWSCLCISAVSVLTGIVTLSLYIRDLDLAIEEDPSDAQVFF